MEKYRELGRTSRYKGVYCHSRKVRKSRGGNAQVSISVFTIHFNDFISGCQHLLADQMAEDSGHTLLPTDTCCSSNSRKGKKFGPLSYYY